MGKVDWSQITEALIQIKYLEIILRSKTIKPLEAKE